MPGQTYGGDGVREYSEDIIRRRVIAGISDPVPWAQALVMLVESGTCPKCGDTLRLRRCTNRSQTCGWDWSPEYRRAKQKIKEAR